jgi:GntR family transcriptional repressor for pyruvate dehydrogenase complex
MLNININKLTIADSVAKQIRQLIMDKELKPGDYLPSQVELAEKLRVGRPSIREALKKLEALGLLEIKHGCSTKVSQVDLESFIGQIVPVLELTGTDVLNLLEAKEIIEMKCAELAAHRATKTELNKMEQYLLTMIQNADNEEKLAEADYLFHLTIIESAKNPVINEIMKMIGAMIHRAVVKTAELRQWQSISLDLHKRLFSAIQQGQGAQAASLVQELITETIEQYKKVFLNGTKNGKAG